MSSRSRKTVGILLSLAVLSGLYLPYCENPAVVLLLFFGWGLMALGSPLVLLAGLLSKEKETRVLGLSCLLSAALFFFGGLGFDKWLRHGRHQTAQTLVMDLAAYHAREGSYPEQLALLGAPGEADLPVRIPHGRLQLGILRE
jgi:hypothetical protein